MAFLRRLLLLCAFAAAVAAQERPVASNADAATSTVIVPVVGSVIGASMAHWKTDLELINDTGHEADVALELSTATDSPAIVLTLAPGEVQRFSDLVGQAFGLDAVLSPLRVTTSGRRSVTVRATVYAISAGEVSPPQPIAVYTPQSFYPLRALDNLAFSDEFRTNIGLLNYSEQDAMFVLALQRIPGRNVAVSYISVGAGSLLHTSIQSLFPLIETGSGFSVVVESGTPETYVYASVIESARQAGQFIAPRPANR
ncbi:MAG: hypothetical protein JO197_19960 [Acidobacteria bacterium]|nr:hypothetical protein [Acidobacteriota bacterium]MBV9474625.1 hypothetical protein [Acidobacteriota bacterium]